LREDDTKKNIVDLVTFLIEKGATVNAKDVDGWTLLHYLCVNYKHGNLLQLIRILKETGADVKAETSEGHTASFLLRSENSEQSNARKAIEVILLLLVVMIEGLRKHGTFYYEFRDFNRLKYDIEYFTTTRCNLNPNLN